MFKKVCLFAALLSGLSVSGQAAANGTPDSEIRVFVDDEEMNIPAEAGKPRVDANGRTFVPLRVISEGLGYQVTWEQKARSITISNKDKGQVILTVGSTRVRTGSGDRVMDASPFVGKDGRTYVPLRFVSESLGYQVKYERSDYVKVSILSEQFQSITLRSKNFGFAIDIPNDWEGKYMVSDGGGEPNRFQVAYLLKRSHVETHDYWVIIDIHVLDRRVNANYLGEKDGRYYYYGISKEVNFYNRFDADSDEIEKEVENALQSFRFVD